MTKDEQVVAHMLELREKLAEMKADYEASIAPVKERYSKGEAYLLQRLQETGHDKFSVPSGTVFTTQLVRASVKDKGAFKGFIEETGEIDLMEVRVSNSALKTYMEEHDGSAPPGVSVSTVRSLNIRRK